MSLGRGLLMALLVLANLATALLIVRDRHEHRQAFVALDRLDKARDELNIEFGRLQLEQATWASPSRIEAIARGQLGMMSPPASSVEMIRE